MWLDPPPLTYEKNGYFSLFQTVFLRNLRTLFFPLKKPNKVLKVAKIKNANYGCKDEGNSKNDEG